MNATLMYIKKVIIKIIWAAFPPSTPAIFCHR